MQAIDLGLSVEWGDCNLKAISQYDSGGFFTWNEAVTLKGGQDIAGQLLGKGWRLPTYAEVEELLINRFQPQFAFFGYGLLGLTVYGRNGRTIFLPASKGLDVIVPHNANYWTSSLDDDDPNMASQFRFDMRGVYGGYNKKEYDQLIRPVFDKTLI